MGEGEHPHVCAARQESNSTLDEGGRIVAHHGCQCHRERTVLLRRQQHKQDIGRIVSIARSNKECHPLNLFWFKR
eukprot:365219-Chlamydomonas_euryale.AAC.45